VRHYQGFIGAFVTTPFLTAVQHQALLALGAALRARKYQFTTVTPATQARVLARPSAPEHSTLRDIFGWSRPFTAAAIDDELLACMRAAGVLEEQDGLLRSTVRMSTLAGEWLFHSAYPTTQADAVFFGPDTCRFVRAMEQTPAPAAEPVRRIVDIGCGSGVGAITLSLPAGRSAGGRHQRPRAGAGRRQYPFGRRGKRQRASQQFADAGRWPV
jgi:methylase of polypeptide subunit release factors